MLTLSYVPAPHAASAPVEPAQHALLTVAFGGDDGIATSVLIPPGAVRLQKLGVGPQSMESAAPASLLLEIPSPGSSRPDFSLLDSSLLAPPLLETWTTTSPVQVGSRGAIAYRYDDRLLAGAIRLAECAAEDLEAITAAAYRQIFAVLDECGFPHLWRVWNFIPHINAEAAGLERYRRFNVARQEAFAQAGRAELAAIPAASAVGCNGGDLAIHFFAGRVAPVPIENPRQLSAYHYPSEYGPRSPLFARACLVPGAVGELLFISGTASIVGHRTLHIGDVRAQTRESLANIDAVLAAANECAGQRRFARGDLSFKVYVRQPADLDAIDDELRIWLPGASAVYLQADICRAELLVEIEASGGHAVAGWSA